MPLRTGRRDWLWGLALGTLGLVAIVGILVTLRGSSVNTYATVEGVKCQSQERLDFHEHAHLSILVRGEVVPVPADIGRMENCLFWLHTHPADGLVHIEAPEDENFTLGQFFAVWGQPLGPTALLAETPGDGEEISATIDGEAYEGDPAGIPLDDQETIVIQLGPPFGTPPSSPFEGD